MTKGTYTVAENANVRKDASFRSCLCALLVFLAICIIILLFTIKWTKNEITEIEKDIEQLGIQGNPWKTTETTTKIYKETTSSRNIPQTKTPLTTTSTPSTSIKSSTITPLTSKSNNTFAQTSTTPYTTPTTISSTIKSTTKNSVNQSYFFQVSNKYNLTTSTASQQFNTTQLPSTTLQSTESPNSQINNTTEDVVLITITPTDFKNRTEIYEDLGNDITITLPTTTIGTDKNLENVTLKSSNTSNVSATESTIKYSTTTEKPFITDNSGTENATELTQTLLPLTKIIQNISASTEATTTTLAIDQFNSSLQSNMTNTTSAKSFEESSIQQYITTPLTSSTTEIDYNYDTLEVVEAAGETSEVTYTTETNLPTVTFENSSPSETRLAMNTTSAYTDSLKTTTTEKYLTEKLEFSLPDSVPVCVTARCKSMTSRMLNLMKHSADPCEDFYEYSCGGLKTEDDSDTWERLFQQLYLIDHTAFNYLKTYKTFYESCVFHEYSFKYEDRISKVLDLVKKVGTITENNIGESIDMTELFANLILTQSLPFMNIDVDIARESSEFILQLTLPKVMTAYKANGYRSALLENQKRCFEEQESQLQQRNLDLNKIHESYITCKKNYHIYLNSVENVVQALGFYSHWSNTYNLTQTIQDLRTTIEWDILDYFKYLPSPSSIKRTLIHQEYSIYTISKLQLDYPYLQWQRLFKILTHRTLPEETLVQVYFPTYFTSLFKEIETGSQWKLKNALIAMYATDLYENMVIPQERTNRKLYCLKLSGEIFHDVTTYLYRNSWGKTEMKEYNLLLPNIFQELKHNLETALNNAVWLDDVSKLSMLSKLKALHLVLYKKEDFHNEMNFFNNKYNFTLTRDQFPSNVLQLIKNQRRTVYDLIGKPFTFSDLWNNFWNLYDKNPSSLYFKNMILAPLGIMQQPVKGLPAYITMARIGLSLAREMGRHFDPRGIQYGITLSAEAKPFYAALQNNFETNASLNMTKSLGQQRITFAASPKLSSHERIADNTALRLISDSLYKFSKESLLPWVSTSFSREKIFFIAVAQEYCEKTDVIKFMEHLFESELLPASLQVENIMTNSDTFSEVFECPVGSTMNNNPSKLQFPHFHTDYANYNYDSSNEL